MNKIPRVMTVSLDVTLDVTMLKKFPAFLRSIKGSKRLA